MTTPRCLWALLASALWLTTGCGEAPRLPTIGPVSWVIPGATLPASVALQPANNNLDVATHRGAVYLAFRTAPTHFANTATELYILRSEDEQTWTFEAKVALGRDLREPRLLSFRGRLFLFFALLGTNPQAFEPDGTQVMERLGPGRWTAPVDFHTPTFIPWRAKTVGSVAYLMGYQRGGEIYNAGRPDVRVHWLQSRDGDTWTPVTESFEVFRGGSSETDFVFLDDLTLVTVMRNEGGDEEGFGSKICTASPRALGRWTCREDPRKFDSPLLFRQGDRVYLVARRQLANDGRFDLGLDTLSFTERSAVYQATYSTTPKRCSLWLVDRRQRTVDWLTDLPSRGDTCFASKFSAVANQDTVVIYNYTSPLPGPDVQWFTAQAGPTWIYRTVLRFP